jgi:hypothetical protein
MLGILLPVTSIDEPSGQIPGVSRRDTNRIDADWEDLSVYCHPRSHVHREIGFAFNLGISGALRHTSTRK